MKKRLIISTIIILLFPYFYSFVFAQNIVNDTNQVTNTITNEVGNKSLAEMQEEVKQKIDKANLMLEYVEGELSSTMIKIQELEDSVLEYQQEIETLGEEITKIQSSIEIASSNLEIVQREYNEKSELLKQRLVAMYESGTSTYLDILLASRNIIEFISGYYLITEMAEYDNYLIKKVEEQKNEIETTKLNLEREQAEIKLKKAKKEQTTVVWQNTKTLQENYVEKLTKAEKILQEQITKYKLEQYEIESLIMQAVNNQIDINIQYTGGQMLWPVAIYGTAITSYYGTREHPVQGVVKTHSGIDIGNADFGSPIVAAADGVVIYAGWLGGYGNCVIINHGNGVTTLYGHGQKIIANLHQEVRRGDLIMEVGSTGLSTGPHLHFEVRYNGSCVNPLSFVKEP